MQNRCGRAEGTLADLFVSLFLPFTFVWAHFAGDRLQIPAQYRPFSSAPLSLGT